MLLDFIIESGIKQFNMIVLFHYQSNINWVEIKCFSSICTPIIHLVLALKNIFINEMKTTKYFIIQFKFISSPYLQCVRRGNQPNFYNCRLLVPCGHLKPSMSLSLDINNFLKDEATVSASSYKHVNRNNQKMAIVFVIFRFTNMSFGIKCYELLMLNIALLCL